MIIVINHTPKLKSSVIRGLIGRYLWRVGRDIWIWPKASIRYNVWEQLDKLDFPIAVEFYWKSKNYLGFKYFIMETFC